MLQEILYRCWKNLLFPPKARSIAPFLSRPVSADTVIAPLLPPGVSSAPPKKTSGSRSDKKSLGLSGK
ncbi:MAG: hypothetical protein DMG40_06055 [Acidobacteria bacterium]|nr:MAG: hypothetical protein DMG40_06055 [Acidobacteriota bacterium]